MSRALKRDLALIALALAVLLWIGLARGGGMPTRDCCRMLGIAQELLIESVTAAEAGDKDRAVGIGLKALRATGLDCQMVPQRSGDPRVICVGP